MFGRKKINPELKKLLSQAETLASEVLAKAEQRADSVPKEFREDPLVLAVAKFLKESQVLIMSSHMVSPTLTGVGLAALAQQLTSEIERVTGYKIGQGAKRGRRSTGKSTRKSTSTASN